MHLPREHGDAVIIGASSLKHIEQNLIDLEKGPLCTYDHLPLRAFRNDSAFCYPADDVVAALDEAWKTVKGVSIIYYQ
jgi:aflatoxin B1 aldehyde reductase